MLRPKRSRVKATLLIGWAVLTVLLPEWIRDHRRTVDRVIYWTALAVTSIAKGVTFALAFRHVSGRLLAERTGR